MDLVVYLVVSGVAAGVMFLGVHVARRVSARMGVERPEKATYSGRNVTGR